MPEILLIQPPIRDFYLTKKRTIPYGLASIASNLIKNGFSVDILDCLATNKVKEVPLPPEMEYLREFYLRPDSSPFSLFYHYRHYGYSLEHIARMVAKSGAGLVGISSLFTPYAQEALKVAQLVKEYLPEAKVVFGGHHPTALPGEVLKHTAVDFVIRGEGELPMVLLAEALKNNTTFSDIPGLCYRDSVGEFIINSPTIIENPDDFPQPAIQLIKTSFYKRKRQGSIMIMAGRGCNMKCSYCSVSASSYLTFRRRSLLSILQELDSAIESGVRFIDFEDENLSINRSWFLELLNAISNRYKGINLELRAMNGLLPTTLDETVIKAMAKAGFKELNLSLCTTSKDQLKRFSRPDVQSAFDRALNLAEKYGLTAVGYIIIGAPRQRPEDSIQDLLFLAERRVLAGLSVYYPSPGSADFENYKSSSLFPEELMLTRSTALPVSQTTTRLETITLLRLGRVVNYLKSLQDLRTKDKPVSSLLTQFLEDGKIRGMDLTSEIYEQNISHSLAQTFLKALKHTNIKAVS